ncbi:MAG: crossover junction endodeoxyribonuclease RuvC [Bacteroidales bacterium]|nr:crossover junction endodeoxyribonuclease RuvC [Bacteroidales bacterium]
MSEKSMKIIGIDPGTLFTGYCILEAFNNNPKIVDFGIIKLRSNISHFDRLKIIADRIQELIKINKPQDLAIEAPFYGKNAQSMLKLGRTQGAIIAMAQINNLNIYEYSPTEVKLSVTGYGNASKQQVSKTVCKLLGLTLKKKTKYDATDAIAIALCHYYKTNKIIDNTSGKIYNSWADFVRNNPHLVV